MSKKDLRGIACACTKPAVCIKASEPVCEDCAKLEMRMSDNVSNGGLRKREIPHRDPLHRARLEMCVAVREFCRGRGI